MGAKFTDWESGGTSGSGGSDGGLFLKLKAGNKYRIRLVGNKPFSYLQYWEPVVCRSPGVGADGTPICPILQANPDNRPKDRYATWVLDRDDGNKLKVMDFPPSLYNYFRDWAANTGKNPGGKDGFDWIVTVKKESSFTKYAGTPLEPTPFTPEELSMIKKEKLGERLADLRRDNTPEEIREMLDKKMGGGSSSGSSDKKSSFPGVSNQSVNESSVDTGVSDSSDVDDDFDF